jgi:hypothetical protein
MTEQSPRYALKVQCPACGAWKGHLCEDMRERNDFSMRVLPRQYIKRAHKVRIEAAKKL